MGDDTCSPFRTYEEGVESGFAEACEECIRLADDLENELPEISYPGTESGCQKQDEQNVISAAYCYYADEIRQRVRK